MARPLAPIRHEEELTLVDHLGELRTRLFSTLAFVIVVFALVFWQSDRVLAIITDPIDHALSTADRSTTDGDPRDSDGLRFGYDERVAQTLEALRRDTGDLAKAVAALADSRAAGQDAELKGALTTLERRLSERSEQLGALALTPPPIDRRPVTLGVTEPFMVTITSSLYAALLLSLPFILYQLYAFVIPAFTPRERKVALPLMLMVPVLFLAGVCFAYFVVLPRAADFLLTFNDTQFDIQVQGREAVRFTTTFLIALGLMFQLPVGILAVTRSGIVSVEKLRQNRGYAIVAFAALAAVLTPTPDPATMLLAMTPLVVLYELSMILASWLDRVRPLDPVGEPGGFGSFADSPPMLLDDD